MKKNVIKATQIFSREDLKKIRGGDYGVCSGQWYNSGDYGLCLNCCLQWSSGSYEYCSSTCGR